MLVEANIDAMVGPTHHFGGLGVGNLASQQFESQPSSPKKAALEGLRKSALIASLGVPQYIWLPPLRPRFEWLAELGFEGSIEVQLQAAYRHAPRAFSAAFSSAFMWAANSSTVTPAVDAVDGRYHFTPANLISSWHRASEAEERHEDLAAWCGELIGMAKIHAPLPAIWPLRDEGAANHMRLCDPAGERGLHVFVHGAEDGNAQSSTFIARHAKAASAAIARRHRLPPENVFFLHQHPEAISAGVFHNDVIATSHEGLLLHHERAFLDGDRVLRKLEQRFEQTVGVELRRIVISEQDLPLADAVRSYLFNSQIVSPTESASSSSASGASASGAPTASVPRMVMICPEQCQGIPAARKVIDRLLADSSVPIEQVHFVELSESMGNGGGPACLRLRVPVAEQHLPRLSPQLRLTERLLDRLTAVVEKCYPERLRVDDLLHTEHIEQAALASRQLRQVVFGSG